MIDFEESDELTAVREVTTAIALDQLDPAARTAEADGVVPQALWTSMHELGLTAPVPEPHGGGVPDAIVQLTAVETLASGDPSIAAAISLSGATSLVLAAAGTPAQREALLPVLGADPAQRPACALYEGFGRSPAEYTTEIVPDGQGWRVRGRKIGVPFGGTASPLVVVGNDESGGLRAAIVPANSVQVTPSSGQLALGSAHLATLEIDVHVADDALLEDNPDALARSICWLRLIPAALMLGTAQRSIEYASEYAGGRVAFGKPISALQGVAFMLAEATTRVDAARLEMWHAASMLDTSEAASLEHSVTLAVNYAGEVATTTTRDAIQVLGGHGFIEDHPVERWYRAAATLSALDFDLTCTTFAAAL